MTEVIDGVGAGAGAIPTAEAATAADSLWDVMSGPGLRSVYQPVVCLDRLAPVGVEALLRGPAGSRWESPMALFEAARAQGRVAALDWASRRAALQGALSARLQGPATLFVNAEPEGLGSEAFPGFDAVVDAVAAAGVQVVLEITERALTSHPAELLRTVGRVRELGWRVALDDVGAERASLALLPFLEPDVIKLDLRLVQAQTTVAIAEIVNAVLAHAERTGAVVLAEGIETERHLDLARSMGARLGQGWYFGRPRELRPDDVFAPLTLTATASTAAGAPTDITPWGLMRELPAVRTAEKALLVAMSKTLERQALMVGEAGVVLGTFQHERFFTPDTAVRYEALAASAAFVAAFGCDMPPQPAAGVRGSHLGDDDPLLLEWDLAVVGPHFAAALVARERTSAAQDRGRLFDYVLTYDRDRVLGVARALMGAVTPAG